MDKREKVIKGLELCIDAELTCAGDCGAMDECPYYSPDDGCMTKLMRDALELVKRSFTPEEVYRTVIEYGQHDRRFRLGDAINYSFSEAVDILRIELMCKAGDV